VGAEEEHDRLGCHAIVSRALVSGVMGSLCWAASGAGLGYRTMMSPSFRLVRTRPTRWDPPRRSEPPGGRWAAGRPDWFLWLG
jgi:hypothetical protein